MLVAGYNGIDLASYRTRQDHIVVGVFHYHGSYFGWCNEGGKRRIANN